MTSKSAVELGQLISELEERFPLSGAESWDAPGLICGSAHQPIYRVMVTVDITAAVVQEAIDAGCDLLLAHHPYLLRGVNSVAETTSKGTVLASAIRAGLAIYAAHTNADIVTDGVSDIIAKRLGLQQITALEPAGEVVGHGRVGYLTDAISLGELARSLAQVLPATATGIRVAGDFDQLVEKVALCGGAGDDFLPNAIAERADVYISSDLRHHVVQDVREISATGGVAPAVVDVAHWAAEWLWLEQLAGELRTLHGELDVKVCDLRTDPWDFVVTQ